VTGIVDLVIWRFGEVKTTDKELTGIVHLVS
jgi:hypothetical protein